MNLLVSYYTKKRLDDANLLFTSEENKGLSKEKKIKMPPSYGEGNKRWAQ